MPGVRFRLIPREEKFFHDFTALADRIVSGATLLEQMLASDPPNWDMAAPDQAGRERVRHADARHHPAPEPTFVTPIDREDIHALAKSLDDVMDAIDAAAGVMRRYRMASLRYGARELASLIWQADDAGEGGGRGAREDARASTTRPSRSTVSRTPPTTCTTRRCVVCSRRSRTRITVIKWKEVLDLLEEATDRCEDVANVLESVVVKHG